jgi:hypothetical protein
MNSDFQSRNAKITRFCTRVLCDNDSVIFHTDRGGEETYIKVWTERAGKLIGFELDQDEESVLMMNKENQQSSSDGMKDKQDAQMRQNEDDRRGV